MPLWWNGRHRGLKILCSKGRAGSNPAGGTMYLYFLMYNEYNQVFTPVADKPNTFVEATDSLVLSPKSRLKYGLIHLLASNAGVEHVLSGELLMDSVVIGFHEVAFPYGRRVEVYYKGPNPNSNLRASGWFVWHPVSKITNKPHITKEQYEFLKLQNALYNNFQ